MAMSAVLSLVTIIAIYREGGILKRLRATPLRPHDHPDRPRAREAADDGRDSGADVSGGASASTRDAPTCLPVPASRSRCCSHRSASCRIGFVLASVVPTARFAQPVGAAVLSDGRAVGPVLSRRLAAAVLRCRALLPLTYAVSLLKGVWRGDGWVAHAGDVAALAAVFLICVTLSAWVFRWE